jgi:hypothetical protein
MDTFFELVKIFTFYNISTYFNLSNIKSTNAYKDKYYFWEKKMVNLIDQFINSLNYRSAH